MENLALPLETLDRTKLADAGGKAANLGELTRIPGIKVPRGFCLTATAFRHAARSRPELDDLLDRLAACPSGDAAEIASLSAEIRQTIESGIIPPEVQAAVSAALDDLGQDVSCAVRSSATAEDLPGASFAGLHSTFLNVRGLQQVLDHIPRCWASLFTDQAVTYRVENGFDHRAVSMAVVVQQMVTADASGVMFTADPLTSDRKTIAIEAAAGSGEPVVSGRVTPDSYVVRDARITAKRLGTDEGQTLPDNAILRLASIGRTIEAHFGRPQDIEWCFLGGDLYIVQSRPITSLFPVPAGPAGATRVFISAGHMQMMTDPVRPLGMSVFELASKFPVDKIGGWMFVDITHDLATPSGRRLVLRKVDAMDPLMSRAVRRLMARKDFVNGLPRGKGNLSRAVSWLPWLKEAYRIYRRNDPAMIDEMVRRHERSLAELAESLSGLSGVEVIDFILNDRPKLQAILFDATGFGAILACEYAAGWLDRNLDRWLGEKNVTRVLSKSVEKNITSNMGLELADVADVVRRHPAVVDYLPKADEEGFFEHLVKLEGGPEVKAVLERFLARYGARCPGEIDITRPRWGERPARLVPMLLNHVRLLKTGRHREMFLAGKREAEAKEADIVRRLEKMPGGTGRARRARRMISLFRNFVGVREYPKYFWMRRYALYKQALMKEAARLAAEGTVRRPDDIGYLYVHELRETIATGKADSALIERRKTDYVHCARMTPPRILISDGEVITGEYEGIAAPPNALIGLPVSSGVVEGRARVVASMEDARLERGDILVTSYTDPSWTPVFVVIAGLVTEVGGMMSHGAVITREYGLPAVVSVENATKLIPDGRRIRVHGDGGWVELL